jgi:hypothetical protein
MKQFITTTLSAVTILSLGIVALQYRVDDLGSDSLNGTNAEAYNLTVDVSTDLTLIAGNALPRILMVAIVVSVIALLLMTR